MFIKPLVEFDQYDLSNHTYYGLVVDNSDPKKLMRVRVRVPELHGTDQDIPNARLPWCMQLRAPSMGGSNISNNIVPRVGSIVSVEFSDGDIHNPIYTGEPAALNLTSAAATTSNYPNVYNFTDPNGNTYAVDLVSNTLTFNFNGNVVGTISGDAVITAGQKLSLNAAHVMVHASHCYQQDVYGYGTRFTWTGGNTYKSESWTTGAVVTSIPDYGLHQPKIPDPT